MLVVIILVGAGASFLYRGSLPLVVRTANGTTTITEYAPPQDDSAPSGSRTYSNNEYKFSLVYPEDMHVTERLEAADGHTITFKNDSGEKAFQIFITPYVDSQISQSRIALDTRSATKPEEIVLAGGLHALLFSSSDPTGESLREIWFLHDKHLYEVTTYEDLDAWLSQVLTTWKFL